MTDKRFDILYSGASFQLFLGRPIFLFFNATGLLKSWKKQHFICRNLTLFIVPFFLFSLFSLFSLFFCFSFFFSFFLFPWGGGGGRRPPSLAPSNDAPDYIHNIMILWHLGIYSLVLIVRNQESKMLKYSYRKL